MTSCAQPLIAVRDVAEYERLESGGVLIMQLHSFEVDHDHGRIGDREQVLGNGVLLWFEVEDFDAAVERAHALHTDIVLPVRRNPPDGYTVVLASPDGEAALPA